MVPVLDREYPEATSKSSSSPSGVSSTTASSAAYFLFMDRTSSANRSSPSPAHRNKDYNKRSPGHVLLAPPPSPGVPSQGFGAKVREINNPKQGTAAQPRK